MTTRDERRAAVRLARRWLDDASTPDDVRLLCATLVDCQEAFATRLAPLYDLALRFVRDDGTQDATVWAAFKAKALECKAYESAAKKEGA